MIQLQTFPRMAPTAVRELAERQMLWARFGLAISPVQINMLVQHQADALHKSGRIDFGGGALKKLADAFCSSPYIQSADWVEILSELTDLFYTLKNETRDLLGDDDLISAMAARFNDEAGGSLDALETTDVRWFLAYKKNKEHQL